MLCLIRLMLAAVNSSELDQFAFPTATEPTTEFGGFARSLTVRLH